MYNINDGTSGSNTTINPTESKPKINYVEIRNRLYASLSLSKEEQNQITKMTNSILRDYCDQKKSNAEKSE